MKKTMLKTMFFFLLLLGGFQFVNAQNYVVVDEAKNLLQTELQNLNDNPILANDQQKDSQFNYLRTKHIYYMHVWEDIVSGQSVADAVDGRKHLSLVGDPATYPTANQEGLNPKTNPNGQVLAISPLHQEVIDLLTQ